uniref:Kinase n=1 Tax=Coptotermes formosanus TaxID=36987 RepID=R4UMM4_COPFO|nr:inositol polyphosphate kinase family protein [Coptotermes formosanus]
MPLAPFIPEFFGCYTKDNTEFVIIEDLTSGFSSPCIADIKIGTTSWDPDAPEEKKSRMKKKRIGTTTQSLGVRIVGMVMQKNGSVVKRLTRNEGEELNDPQFYTELKNFVPNSLKDSFKSVIEKISSLYVETLDENPGFRIYSSSLLVIYDGDNPTEIRVKIIDLAHCHSDIRVFNVSLSDSAFDDGFFSGLNNLKANKV